MLREIFASGRELIPAHAGVFPGFAKTQVKAHPDPRSCGGVSLLMQLPAGDED